MRDDVVHAIAWQQQLIDLAAAAGRETHAGPLGVGIEFADGCDAFWALPGEWMSTIPLAAGAVDAAGVFAEYERIDALRERGLHVIRHYLASRGFHVVERRTGRWALHTQGYSVEFDAPGVPLTRALVQSEDFAESLRALFVRPDVHICKPPSPRRVARYLAIVGPPPPVLRVDTPPRSPPLAHRVGEHEARAAASGRPAYDDPSAPLVAWTKAMAALLPETPARFDSGLGPAKPEQYGLRRLELDFPDGFCSWAVELVSHEWQRAVDQLGPAAAAGEVAGRFRELSAGRVRILRAVFRAAGDRGWGMQRRTAPESSIDMIHLGKEIVEVSMPVGPPLTSIVGECEGEAAIARLVPRHDAFAAECRVHLDAEGPLPELPRRTLRQPLPPPLELPEPDAATIAKVDAVAARILADAGTVDLVQWAADGARHRPGHDRWVTAEMKGRIESAAGSSDSQTILRWLTAGDPLGREAAIDLITRLPPPPDPDDDE